MCNIKTLIISSCCASKDYSLPLGKSPYCLNCFLAGHKPTKIASLIGYEKEAINMYIGHQYGTIVNPGPLKKALQILDYNKISYDFKIVSAGYGFIDQHDKIVPYDICFDEISKNNTSGLYTLKKYSEELNIHKDIQTAIKEYNLIIFILAGKYTDAIQMPFKIEDNQKVIFIDKNSTKISKMKNTININSAMYITQYSGTGAGKYKIRANIFNHLIQSYIKDGKNPFEEIFSAKLSDLVTELKKYSYNNSTYSI